MTPQVRHFMETWERAFEAGDANLLGPVISERCELHSAVVLEPEVNKAYLIEILDGAMKLADEFSYRKKWIDDSDIIFEFEGSVDGQKFTGFERIWLDDMGMAIRFEIAMRRLTTLVAFSAKVREHAMHYQPEAANT